ncbi:phage portal protein [Aliarcobacter cryaerophilus]|uniref:phage portal protein n=1 Tax=Aliarcobacter cryaerophilus TaxID=28198 RepID=UPI0021B45872|nr:phage portal protein [Aliarcobacter cryaerophilus]MCT7468969.1 phage portal protein [Aliarcobacter cryaerophilus]
MFNIFRNKNEEKRSYSASIAGSTFDDLTVNDAMTIPAVYSAVNTISTVIASTKIDNAPRKLKREPQDNMSTFTWFSTITKNILLNGNAYARITDKELILLDPKSVSAYYSPDYQKIVYYQYNDLKIYPEDILHFRGMSKDNLGQMGYSPLINFANSFSRFQAASEYEGNYMINAARPSLWIESIKNLSQIKIDELKDSFRNKFQGTKNAGGVVVMADGMKLHQLNPLNTLVDAEIIKLKELSIKEVAMIFNIPVSMLDNSLATYSNAVEANLNFLKMTINPLLTNIKEEINMKLSSNLSFDTSSLIEGSFAQKIETLTSAVAGGILTSNEARARLNYSELEDGNKLFSPAGTPGMQEGLNGQEKL